MEPRWQNNCKWKQRQNHPSLGGVDWQVPVDPERRLICLQRGIFTVWQNDGSWMRKRDSGDSGRCNGRSNAIVDRRITGLRRAQPFLFTRRRHDCSWMLQWEDLFGGRVNRPSKAIGDRSFRLCVKRCVFGGWAMGHVRKS